MGEKTFKIPLPTLALRARVLLPYLATLNQMNMKLRLFPFLLLALFTVIGFSACGDDDDTVQDSLNYDGPNFTAPNQPAGNVAFAAFFPPSEVQGFNGRTLESVRFWIEQVPARTEVVIYAAGADDNEPSNNVLYRQDVTQRINTGGDWVTHRLNDAVVLDGTGIWLSIEVDLATFQQSVGCDQGLNYSPNGDRLRLDNGTWTDFFQLTGGEQVNWNIRGFLAEE